MAATQDGRTSYSDQYRTAPGNQHNKMGELMHLQSQIPSDIQDLLCCPICHAKLRRTEGQFECADPGCAAHFPIIEGMPILINERSSVFEINNLISQLKSFGCVKKEGKLAKLKKTVRRSLPSVSKNIKGKLNYPRFCDVLLNQSTSPRVLVIGGSILGQGMEFLSNNAAISLVETDVSFGPRTMSICDAHDIPFEDQSFDGVVIQAVLEHVVDPNRCCEELYRVLKEQGVVYAETPFMQQVHGGRYDFTRFTYLGHRRLFRRFTEIDSGAACGPGMALAWAYQYFLMSFSESKRVRALLSHFASLTSFYLKYFDYYLIDKPGTLDAASAYYFLGRKAKHALPDHDLIRLYRGVE